MPGKDKTGPFGKGKECDDPRGKLQGGEGFSGKGTGEGKGRKGRKKKKDKTIEAMLNEGREKKS